MIEWVNEPGIFHAETGTQTCPKRVDPNGFRQIVDRIVHENADLLKRLADG